MCTQILVEPELNKKEKERKETADRPWHCYVEKITGDLANARILNRSARYAQRIG